MRNTKSGFLYAIALASVMAGNGCGSSSGGGEGGSGGTSTGSGKGGSSAASSSGAGSSANAGSSGGSSSRSSGGGGSGGSSPTGGSSSASSVPNCPTGPTCAGDLVGTWTVTSKCLSFSGDMDGVPGSLGCPTVPVVGTLDVTGTWTAKADKTYVDKTTTTGTISFTLEPSCLTVSMAPVECKDMGFAFTTLGWKSVVCSESNGKCKCAGTTEIKGGLGTASPYASDSGDYEISGSTLSLDKQIDYSYCVEGNKMTVTPKPGILPIKGTIVLQKATGGTGGGGSTGTTTGGTTTSSSSKGGTGGNVTGGTTSSSSKGGTGGTATGGTSGTAGASGGSTVPGTGSRPCDIYAAGNVKCAAAHSTVRALYAAYSGKLYRVKRDSDKTYQDIPTIEPGGVADSSVQDTFCAGTKCTITRLWDQSGNGNYVDAETQDAEEVSARPQPGNNGMSAANATQEALTVSGKKVYALYMKTAQAYWHDGSKTKMPLGKEPQGVYMVTSGKHFGDGCCFNYGNGPLSRKVTACGTIDAVNFSSNKIWDYGAGTGPWIMADFECGLVAGGKGKAPTMSMPYVVAIEKNKGTGDYVLRGGDAQKGTLTTQLTTKLPFTMGKEGAVNLGSGGDCCYSNTTMSQGNFYEGAIIAGYPSDETEDQVQANIVSAAYKEGN